MKFLPLLLPFLVACSTSQCSTTPIHVGPTPPLPPYHPENPDVEVLIETYTPVNNIIQFNPDKFAACSALEVVYDTVDYGIILPTDDLYLPTDHVYDRHTIEITCIDSDSNKVKVTTITQIHVPTTK